MKLDPETVARASSRHPWRTLGVWVVLIVAMGAVSSTLLGGVLSQDVEFTNRPESVKAQSIIDKAFPGSEQGTDTVFFIVGSQGNTSVDSSFQQLVRDVQAAVQKLGPDVVAGPPVSYLDLQARAGQMFTPDYHGALIALNLKGEVGSALERVQAAASQGAPPGFTAQTLMPDQLPLMTSSSEQTPTIASGPAPDGFVMVSSNSQWITDATFADAVRTVQ